MSRRPWNAQGDPCLVHCYHSTVHNCTCLFSPHDTRRRHLIPPKSCQQFTYRTRSGLKRDLPSCAPCAQAAVFTFWQGCEGAPCEPCSNRDCREIPSLAIGSMHVIPFQYLIPAVQAWHSWSCRHKSHVYHSRARGSLTSAALCGRNHAHLYRTSQGRPLQATGCATHPRHE